MGLGLALGCTGNGKGAGGALILRAHHLLCLLGFRGLGYSKAFVDNMRRIAARLRAEPERLLIVQDGPDAICDACPHSSAEGCRRDENTEPDVSACTRDRQVLQLLGLVPGAEITVRSVYGRVAERVSPDDMADRICAACEWKPYGYCEEGLKALKGNRG